MNDLAGKHIVLGLSGGIACYKAAELCRALVKAGATVQVSGDVTVAATNRNTFANSVTASLGNEGKAAAAIAVSQRCGGPPAPK